MLSGSAAQELGIRSADPVRRLHAAAGRALRIKLIERNRIPRLWGLNRAGPTLDSLGHFGWGLTARLGFALVRQPGDGSDVGFLGVWGEVAHLHVLKHALTERCHGNLLS